MEGGLPKGAAILARTLGQCGLTTAERHDVTAAA